MTTRPSWVRRAYLALAIAAGVVGIAVWVVYSQITAEPELAGLKRANELDGQEAARKLKLYNEALATSRRGFVRLSEVELNSYLQMHFFSKPARSDSPTAASRTQLLTGRLELLNDGAVWYCWVRDACWGRSVDLVWERTLQPEYRGGHWTLQTRAMRLGRLKLPRTLWSTVQKRLGSVDRVFASQSEWWARVPSLEIRTNETSITPELRLFTYATDTASLRVTP